MTLRDRALMNTSGREGATVQLPEGPLRRAMQADGLIGPKGGITRAGLRERARVLRAAEGGAFG
jgi:hypothetical protein